MLKLLTSPLAGLISTGLSCILALSLAVTVILKNKEISALDTKLKDEQDAARIVRKNNDTLWLNNASLELGLNKCNKSVEAMQATNDAITRASVGALKEVQKAGASVDRKVREIDAMPKETCEDAFNILKQN